MKRPNVKKKNSVKSIYYLVKNKNNIKIKSVYLWK